MRGDLSTVIRGGFVNLVGAAVNGLATFALFAVLARALGAGLVGAFFVGVAVFTILTTTAQMGAQVGLVRMIARSRTLAHVDELRSTLTAGLVPVAVLGVVAAFAMVAFADVLSTLFAQGENGAQAAVYVRALAPFVPFAALTLSAISATQGFGTMLPAVIVDRVGRTLTQLALAVLFASLGGLAVIWVWAGPYIAAFVALLVCTLWLLRRAERTPGVPGGRSPTDVLTAFWRFSAPRGVASFFQVAILWTDTILVGVLRSVEDAGIYAVSTRFLAIGHLAVGAVLQVTGPKLSEVLTARQHGRAQHVYRSATTLLMALVWPAYITLAIFAPLLLRLFGPEFLEGRTALVILAIAMLVSAGSGPVDIVLLMGGRSWWSLGNWAVAFAVNVGLNLWLIPLYGINGAAIAWGASILVRNLIPILQVRWLLGLHPFGYGYAVVVCASVAVFGGGGLALRGLLGATVPALVWQVVAGAAVYGAVLWLTRARLLEAPPETGAAAIAVAPDRPLGSSQ